MRRLRDAESFARQSQDDAPAKDRNRPEACCICGDEGITDQTVYPLRTVDRFGKVQELRWAHNHCRRPTTATARKVDSWARGETTPPDEIAASAIRAAIDLSKGGGTKEDRRDLMAFLKERIGRIGA